MNIEKVQSFVGEISEEALTVIDCFIGERVALFIPAVGQCTYSITKQHTHPAYSFVLTFDENLTVGDEKQKSQLIEKGALIGMSPDFRHHEEESEDFSRYYAIFIEPDYYNELLSHYDIKQNPHYPFTVAKPSKALLPYLREFMVEAAVQNRSSHEKKIALETLISHQIVEAFHSPQKEDEKSTIHERIEIDRAVEFIHGNFGKKLTVDEIAKEVCLSPSHLSSIFKKEVGKTVMGYLTDIRLQTARKQLLLRKHSISEIAFLCGFSSPSHLSQSFKNHFGLSPRDILKST
jgi:AraC family transcriptional regulator